MTTTIGEDGNIVRKDKFANRFAEQRYQMNFSCDDIFVMESTRFHEPV
ncbi:MAG: hypothetical protein QXZ17_12135 [Nitrososphaerota archaeon]